MYSPPGVLLAGFSIALVFRGSLIGGTLGHYKTTSLLGKGGMGEVYRATDTSFDRDDSVKRVP